MTLINGRTLYLPQLFFNVSVYLDLRTLTSHETTIKVSVQDHTEHLFLLKDARFSTLSKSSAIMSFHWDDFNVFLSTHEYITNKLAWDALCLEYIRVVVVVIAAIGVQLIAPYHAMTISNKSIHSSLKLFFENLYEELWNHQDYETFFSLTSLAFKSVSDKLFTEIQKNYGLDVVKAIKHDPCSNYASASYWGFEIKAKVHNVKPKSINEHQRMWCFDYVENMIYIDFLT